MNSLKRLLNFFSKELLDTLEEDRFNPSKIDRIFKPYLNKNLFLLIIKLESFIPI